VPVRSPEARRYDRECITVASRRGNGLCSGDLGVIDLCPPFLLRSQPATDSSSGQQPGCADRGCHRPQPDGCSLAAQGIGRHTDCPHGAQQQRMGSHTARRCDLLTLAHLSPSACHTTAQDHEGQPGSRRRRRGDHRGELWLRAALLG